MTSYNRPLSPQDEAYRPVTWVTIHHRYQIQQSILLFPSVPEEHLEASAQDDVMRGVGVVEGAVLERVGVQARGVAQLALVLLQDWTADQTRGVEEIVVGDDVVVLLLAEAELALLRVYPALPPLSDEEAPRFV